MNPRRPPRRARPLGRHWSRLTRCQVTGCGELVRNMTAHLIAVHRVPLVRLGQGEYARDYNGRGERQ
jgi:hypothetical protein